MDDLYHSSEADLKSVRTKRMKELPSPLLVKPEPGMLESTENSLLLSIVEKPIGNRENTNNRSSPYRNCC